MEIDAKTIAAGVGLFVLGGLSIYLLTAKTDVPAQPTAQYQTAAMQEALAHVRASKTTAMPEAESIEDTTIAASEVADELTYDTFLAQAEARREQQFIDKAEADRLAKLKLAKERSVECKFWKQQQKTSSAAAKVEEKIIQYCTLQTTSSSDSTSSTASVSSNTNTSSASLPDAGI